MYRNILVATDGSPRSLRAVRSAARLAAELRASLSALYVTLEGMPNFFSGGTIYASAVLGRQYEDYLRRQADEALEAARAEAKRAKVPITCLHRVARHPWKEILATARSRGCDLIVMASHGLGGVQQALLGSETQRVLTHSAIPVLVCR